MIDKTTPEGTGIVPARVIAKRYKVTERAVCQWAARGTIPSFKIGSKTLRFRLEDVIAKLEGAAGERGGN